MAPQPEVTGLSDLSLCAKALTFSSRAAASLRRPEPGPTPFRVTPLPEPPFLRLGPELPASPVVLSVPHAGRSYRRGLLDAARVSRNVLESLEDRLADRLVWRAVAAGVTAIVALAPRAEIDLNREEREIDPALIVPPLAPHTTVQSMRTRGGLGLVPSRIAGAGAIWKSRVPRQELERRITEIHRPYHDAVAATLAAARRRFGTALLLDVHSMPPRRPSPDGEKGTIVLGDRHGTSCAGDLFAAAAATARKLGYRAVCNIPYAGGHIAARHGKPARGVHAIQVEIDRAAYLDVEMREPGPGFAATCELIERMVEVLEARMLASPDALAAE